MVVLDRLCAETATCEGTAKCAGHAKYLRLLACGFENLLSCVRVDWKLRVSISAYRMLGGSLFFKIIGGSQFRSYKNRFSEQTYI